MKEKLYKVKEWRTDDDPQEDMLNKGLMIGCLMAVAIFITMNCLWSVV